MFRNPGEKLKVLALIFFILGCIATVIGTILSISESRVWVYTSGYNGSYIYSWWLIFVLPPIGVLGSWLCCIGLYAFGQLVTSTEEHTYQNDQIIRELKKLNATEAEKVKKLEAQATAAALQAASAPNPVQAPASAPIPSQASSHTPVVLQKPSAAGDDKWRCTKCGYENNGLSRFCVSCGEDK